MTLNEYQKFCPETFINGLTFEVDMAHITNGVFAEAGEIAAAYQKFYRGDYGEDELRSRISGEIGGLMYYLAMMCNIEGLSLSNILENNVSILLDRKSRGAIQGDGDER